MRQARHLGGKSGCVAVLCALLIGAADPQPPSPAQPEIHVDADTATVRGDKEPKVGPDIHAEGHVHAIRGAMELRGDDLVVDREQRYGILTGNVVGIDGLLVVFAKQLRFDLPDHTLQLYGNATAVIKKSTGPAATTALALSAGFNSSNPLCVRTLGGNALTMHSDWIRRNPDGTFDAKPAWFTTCACSDGCIPLLSMSAMYGWIKPGDRANFTWAFIRLFNVPILPVPWISMPLSDRATGLLFPFFGQTATGGIDIGEPVFVALGRSADLTAMPMYYFGTSNSNNFGTGPLTEGVRGFGDDSQLRWRPSDSSVGSLRVVHIYDDSDGLVHGIRGNREEFWLEQTQDFLGGRGNLEFNAATDSDFVEDTAGTTAEQNRSYLRSWAEYSRKAGPFDFALDSNYIEDLQASACAVSFSCFPRTPWKQIPSAITPLARATIGTANRLGWVMLSEQLTVGYEDSWAIQPPPDTPHSRRLSTSGFLTQTVPFASGRFGTLALETGERLEDLITPDQPGFHWRGGGYAGLNARTTLARTFASGWTHDFVPSLQVRALDTIGPVSYSRGLYADRFTTGMTPLPQDELDLALPSQATVQAIIGLATHLSPPGLPAATLSVEQHIAFLPFDSGQLKASLSVPFGFNSITVSGGRAFSPGIAGWTPASVTYTRIVPGIATIQVGAAYGNVSTDDQISRGMDLLFTPRFELPPPAAVTGPPAISYAIFAHVSLLKLGPFAVLLNGTFTDDPYAQPSQLIQDYGLTVYYEAPGCGRLSLVVHWTHTSGQPLASPIVSPNYIFGDMRDITRAQQSLAGPSM